MSHLVHTLGIPLTFTITTAQNNCSFIYVDCAYTNNIGLNEKTFLTDLLFHKYIDTFPFPIFLHILFPEKSRKCIFVCSHDATFIRVIHRRKTPSKFICLLPPMVLSLFLLFGRKSELCFR
jgi:hypothetical protein